MSDHFSGPAVIDDPSVDVTDFFAFPSPERPGNLVLVMDVLPLASPKSGFRDVVTHRFRLQPFKRPAGATPTAAEHTIDVTFSDVPEGRPVQKGSLVTSSGRRASFVVGTPTKHAGVCDLRGGSSAIRSSWTSRPRCARICRASCLSTRP